MVDAGSLSRTYLFYSNSFQNKTSTSGTQQNYYYMSNEHQFAAAQRHIKPCNQQLLCSRLIFFQQSGAFNGCWHVNAHSSSGCIVILKCWGLIITWFGVKYFIYSALCAAVGPHYANQKAKHCHMLVNAVKVQYSFLWLLYFLVGQLFLLLCLFWCRIYYFSKQIWSHLDPKFI